MSRFFSSNPRKRSSMMASVYEVALFAFLQIAVCYGRPSPPDGGTGIAHAGTGEDAGVNLTCPANEATKIATKEDGCNGMVAINRANYCGCLEGFVRRETDRACVRKSECGCPLNEVRHEGDHEPGCAGPLTFNPGDCACAPGFRRRESDRICVQESDCDAESLQTETFTCPVNEVHTSELEEPYACTNAKVATKRGCKCKDRFWRRKDGHCATGPCNGSEIELKVPCYDTNDVDAIKAHCNLVCPYAVIPNRGFYCTAKGANIMCVCGYYDI